MENLLRTSFSYEAFPKFIVDFLKENKKIGLVLEEKDDSGQINIGVKKLYSQKVMNMSENINLWLHDRHLLYGLTLSF